ncbi:MAG: VanW family protein [bacterium]|nr:VanW family protein [bacterium]
MMLIALNKYLALLFALLVFFVPFSDTHAADPLLTEVKISAENAKKLSSTQIQFTRGGKTWKLSLKDSKSLYKTRSISDDTVMLQLRPGAIYSYLNIYISPKVNNIGEQSRFVRENGKVMLIKGGTKGSTVDGMKTSLALRNTLVAGRGAVPVYMMPYRPSVFSAADFEKLKFSDLLTTGETNFAGSPKNRVHNIKVGTARFNGLVIMPNEEFAFNTYLGEVDEKNGYLPELVIKENVTTPEYGGGICQVSTTAFRAAMQAGLDVTYRKNHSYPVSYYGAPGYDATVYQPAPDFRFKNDMATPVLLKTSIAGTKVKFEVWGKKDGRVVKINGPFTTEKKPDGSLTAAVAQIVTKAGKVIREENFVSKYQSKDKFPEVRKVNGE